MHIEKTKILMCSYGAHFLLLVRLTIIKKMHVLRLKVKLFIFGKWLSTLNLIRIIKISMQCM